MRPLTVLLTICLAASILCAEASFPLKVHDSGRYVIDKTGRPFFYNADTAWMLFMKLTEEEATQYLEHRKSIGFNAIQIMLTGVPGMANRAGQTPFRDNNDFSTVNEPYFAHVDRVIAKAEKLDLLLAIAPLWESCCRDGWGMTDKDGKPAPIPTNGPAKCREFGRYIGKRYARFQNLWWILGGDNDPHSDKEAIRQLAMGIKEAAPHHLCTYHAASSHTSTDVWPADEKWLDIVMLYTYFRGFNKAWNKNQPDVYEQGYKQWAKTPVRPYFLGESTYEGEHGDWGSAVQARKQAYWAVLSGAFGNAYGSPNWNFPRDWRAVMRLPGAESLGHYRRLFESRPWWRLVPDIDNKVAIDGRGEFATNNYATTARADDGSFAISYLPTARRITIDLAQIGGKSVRAWWFGPRDGQATRIGEFPNSGQRSFEPPGPGDWALVLDDAERQFAPPGQLK